MNGHCLVQPLSTTSVDFDDRTYSLVPWDEPPGNDLTASIKRFGILHPPMVFQDDDGRCRIVTGRKRLAVAHNLFHDRPVYCIVVDQRIPDVDIFRLILEESKAGKGMSVMEQIVFLDKLLRTSTPPTALTFLEEMGHKPQQHILQDLLQLKDLEESVQRALHQGSIPVRNARKLLKLSKPDQDLIMELISRLHLGGSRQQKLIDHCTQLIFSRESPLQEILTGFNGQTEATQPENIPRQGVELLDWLHGECHPRLSRAESDFKLQVARLDLQPHMQIRHTEAFEDSEITLSIRLPDLTALVNIVRRIACSLPEQLAPESGQKSRQIHSAPDGGSATT